MYTSPFEQFNLSVLFPLVINSWGNSTEVLNSLNLSITNSTLYMFIGLAIFAFVTKVVSSTFLVSPKTAIASVFTELHKFLFTVVVGNIGSSNLKYFPFISTVFVFICTMNLLGMIPYSFTVTSHISVTFSLAFGICVSLLILGLQLHKATFFKSFLPEGTPLPLVPLLTSIEIVSYLSHSVSLSVRLFANMLSGHAILKILSGFVASMSAAGGVFSVLALAPFTVVFALTGMECCIAILQAYVFTVLTCIYLKDAIYPH
jgi:ATP synthase subunit 6